MRQRFETVGLKAGMKDTQNAAMYTSIRRAARRLCKHGTMVLSFGWNSNGMGAGFETVELMLVAHGGAHSKMPQNSMPRLRERSGTLSITDGG